MKEILSNFADICKKYELEDDKILNKAKHEQELKQQAMKVEVLKIMLVLGLFGEEI
jgi:hypothetical protein